MQNSNCRALKTSSVSLGIYEPRPAGNMSSMLLWAMRLWGSKAAEALSSHRSGSRQIVVTAKHSLLIRVQMTALCFSCLRILLHFLSGLGESPCTLMTTFPLGDSPQVFWFTFPHRKALIFHLNFFGMSDTTGQTQMVHTVAHLLLMC